jgi:hypothetical protein
MLIPGDMKDEEDRSPDFRLCSYQHASVAGTVSLISLCLTSNPSEREPIA